MSGALYFGQAMICAVFTFLTAGFKNFPVLVYVILGSNAKSMLEDLMDQHPYPDRNPGYPAPVQDLLLIKRMQRPRRHRIDNEVPPPLPFSGEELRYMGRTPPHSIADPQVRTY
uniref:Uncharacterized protein n=1 Tax=Steinernema glaseri TaxID=37863 RepID=A0A1I7ZQ90_9BILA